MPDGLLAEGQRGHFAVGDLTRQWVGGIGLATAVTHLIIRDPLWAGIALGLCNGAEALITAGLIRYYFGSGFNLVRARNVISLLAAAVAGASVSGIGGAVTYRLMR